VVTCWVLFVVLRDCAAVAVTCWVLFVVLRDCAARLSSFWLICLFQNFKIMSVGTCGHIFVMNDYTHWKLSDMSECDITLIWLVEHVDCCLWSFQSIITVVMKKWFLQGTFMKLCIYWKITLCSCAYTERSLYVVGYRVFFMLVYLVFISPDIFRKQILVVYR